MSQRDRGHVGVGREIAGRANKSQQIPGHGRVPGRRVHDDDGWLSHSAIDEIECFTS